MSHACFHLPGVLLPTEPPSDVVVRLPASSPAMSVPAPTPSPDRAEAARATMTALAGSSDVFETFFDQAQIGLALADLSTRYVRVNSTYADLVGRLPEDLVGVPFSTLLHPDDRSDDASQVSLLLHGSEHSLQSEQRYLSADGRVRWVLHGVTVVPGSDGSPAWFAVSAQDISERRRAEQDLRDLTSELTARAVRDPLTGLANRTLLEERLRAVLARDARTGDTTGVLFLDLDGFKAVNDEHGHLLGDAVLRAVAARLTAAVRPSDTVARLGGDEFVVLVEGATLDGVAVLADRLRAEVSAPILVGDLDLNVGVSVGLALSEAGAMEPATLLARADRGMYAEKRAALRRPTGPPDQPVTDTPGRSVDRAAP
jgi:diguanylate cyclase (GGDEF)-like protein/PAS domain S-box-containing protein